MLIRAQCRRTLSVSILAVTICAAGGQDADAAVLRSVQSGTASLSVGAGASQTVNVTITPVDSETSILFFNVRGDSNQPGDGQIRGQLTSSSNIQFFRADDTSTTAFTIQWYVAEFCSGVSVQRGTFTSVDTTGDVTINAVTLANSFVLVSGSVASGDTTYSSDDYWRARLTSTTNLEIIHNTTASKTADWQVVEYTDSSVQRNIGTLSGTATSATVSITTVNLAKSIVLLSWKSDINATGANFLRAHFSAADEITITRDVGTSATIDYAWEVVEFTDATAVQRGVLNFTSGETADTATLTAVDLNASVALLSTAGGGWGGSHAYTADDQIGPGMFTTALANSTTLTCTRQITGSVAADAAWFVIEFPSDPAAVTDIVAGLDGFWKLNDGAGGSATDSSGNGNAATITNAAWDDGIFGGALNFDGSGDFVDLPTSIADSSLGSVSFWFRTATNFGDLAHLYYGSDVATGNGLGSQNELHVNLTSSETLQFFIEGTPDVDIQTAATYADGAWHHLAATWDINDDAMLYVDGQLVDFVAHDADSFTFSSTHRMARPATNTRLFTGKIDDVRLFNRVILSCEVAELAAGNRLLGHWKLDDGGGGTAADSVGSNDGTLQPVATPPTWEAGRKCGALHFDGSEDYVAVSANALLNTAADVTITGWFKLDAAFSSASTTSQIILEKYLDNDNDMVIALVGTDYGQATVADGSLVFKLENGGLRYKWTNRTSWTAGQWYHFAATLDVSDPANNAVFINGTDDTSGTDVGSGSADLSYNAAVEFGGRNADTSQLSGTRFTDGVIDDVRIYNRILSTEEIQALAATYTIIDLRSLNGQRGLGVAINDSEQVAGFDQASADGAESAWVSQYCLFTALGTLGSGADSAALDINNGGRACGWSHETDGDRKAFTWTSGGGMVDLGTLAGTSDSEATGINANDEVCGTSLNFGAAPDDWSAFLYLPVAAYSLPMGMNSLGTLGGPFSVAMDLNDSGQVVGGASTASDFHEPFIWLPAAAYSLSAGMNSLGTLGGSDASILHRAEAINSNGETVGLSFTAGGAMHAFLWLPAAAYGQSAGMNDLGVLTGGNTSWAFDINDSGQVVGTSNVTGGAYHAFLWESGTLSDLNDLTDTNATWTLIRATGINDDGEIVGWGTDGDGNTKAFVLTQTCSTGQATVGSTAGVLLAELSAAAGADGVVDRIVLDGTGRALAEFRVAGGPVEADFELRVRSGGLGVEGVRARSGLSSAGLRAGSVVNRTLEASSTTPAGGFRATVGMFVRADELATLGLTPAELSLHVFEPGSSRWEPAGFSVGETAPTGVVGEAGYVRNADGSVTYWSVRDRLSLFAVGATQAGRPEPARHLPAPPVCGLGIMQGSLLLFAGLIMTAARRRRRDCNAASG